MGDTLNSLSGLGIWLAFGGLAVMAVLALIVGRRGKRRGAHGVAAGHRLAVLDQVPIDQTRRLVLIQRDEVQHLVILGGGSDFLVESGIRSGEPTLATGHTHHHHGEPHHRPVFLDEPHRAPPEPAAAPVAARTPEPEPRPEPRPVERPAAERPVERPAPVAAREPLIRPAAPRRPVTNVKPAEPAAPEPRLDMELEPASPPPPRAVMDTPRPRPPVRPEAKAEPRLDPAEKSEGGRVAVKLDPFFAGMVDQLEETLRRPNLAGEGARTATVTATTVTVTAAPVATPATRPAPEAPILDVAPLIAVKDEPTAAAAPEILPPLTASDEVPTEKAPPIVVPTAQDRPAAPGDDAFEIEMANLLGRKRP
ncbi:flagellar biosynthetic protein FliO [Ancylobacter sp. WKF20]|uniref:flagellar biosynthetic protein FliO n=1 Tax=Ancylobacter sp. WKF20 TaxID=3039801 RepID=UPI0024344848|nr:flagellar biosynthetic protein FliO [Ancylobacter sp. WKF20]WGD31722.1 flagellar biosynthetic protein FliO [Ancylobacter sp. WKF20]